jgi:predicted nucleic acid-binding protein
MKNVWIVALALVSLCAYFLLTEIDETKDTITTSDNTVDSLMRELEYYKEREKIFLHNNSALKDKVFALERDLNNYQNPKPQSKVTRNETNPLVSSTQSKYFNSVLSDRYKDKP